MASSALASHGKSSGGKTKRRVKFNRDTVFNDSDHIALTITRHSFIYDKGYTQYFIKVNPDLRRLVLKCFLTVRNILLHNEIVAVSRGRVDFTQEIQGLLQFAP